MLPVTCKITLLDSPHTVIINENPGFRALYLTSRNKFRFCLINTKTYFFHFGCWILPEKFSICPKNNGFAGLRGAAAPSPPGSYTYDTVQQYDQLNHKFSNHW